MDLSMAVASYETDRPVFSIGCFRWYENDNNSVLKSNQSVFVLSTLALFLWKVGTTQNMYPFRQWTPMNLVSEPSDYIQENPFEKNVIAPCYVTAWTEFFILSFLLSCQWKSDLWKSEFAKNSVQDFKSVICVHIKILIFKEIPWNTLY